MRRYRDGLGERGEPKLRFDTKVQCTSDCTLYYYCNFCISCVKRSIVKAFDELYQSPTTTL